MSDRQIMACVLAALIIAGMVALFVTATFQMAACRAMCGASGVMKFSLHHQAFAANGELPACECAGGGR